jgi:putative ABC transport system permease protein
MTIFSLAIKIFFREFRSGQLLLMFFSLSLAVGIVASITFFTDRLDGSLMMESKQFLGGDLKYESDTPLDESSFPIGDYLYANFYEFGSVLGSSKKFQLASVKSVSPPYPLVGEFEILKKYDERVLETNPPKPGKVWLDTRLANLLEVAINDKINIGEKDFSISGIILAESDRGAGSFAFAPKAIMNSSDLEEANVIQPGSRVRHSYVFAGSEKDIKLLENFFQSKKKPGDEITTPGNETSPLGRAIKRASNFFLLGALLAIILSSLAIAICSLQFTRRHVDYVAIFKALGLSPVEIRNAYLLILSLIALFSFLTGIFLGWVVQLSFMNLLTDYFPSNLPLPGLDPYLISLLTAFLCLMGFAYPILRNLFNLSPNVILRKSEKNLNAFDSSFYIVGGLSAFYVLLIFFIKDFYLTNIIFFSIVIFSGIIFAFIYGIFHFIKPLGLNPHKPMKMLAFELSRRKLFNSMQIVAITVAIALSLVAYSASTNLVGSWKSSLPDNAPNNLLFNIYDGEKENLVEFLRLNEIAVKPLFPVTSARFQRLDSNKEIDRTFNFTWMDKLPEGNEVIAGKWFENKNNGISISSEISERYELQVDDQIVIDIAGRKISSFIQSIREVNWENFSPNFFAIGFPDDFEEISSTFITSFHIPQEKKPLSSELMRTFPTMSYISLDAIILEVQSIISKVSQALKLILGLTLIAGLFLMLATIQESFKQREKQNAILKTLGLNRKVMQKNTFMEYLSIGLFSGLLGSMLAVITTFFIEEIVFEINSQIYWEVILIGAFGSILVIGIIAAIFTFYLSSKTPKDVLRGADG